MPNIPGKYGFVGTGIAALKGVAYPSFLGKQAATGNSGKDIPQQEEKQLPIGNSGKDIPPQDVEITNRMTVGGDGDDAQSWLGTPVFADIRLKADSSEDDSQSLYMDTVLITVSQEKHIIKTAVNGRNGTIKEYFSDGDFSITIEGSIVGRDQSAYPEADVKNLIRLIRQPSSIVAISPFLQLFGIYDIVIEDHDIKQAEGFQNMQPFTIHCSSDLPIELIDVEDDFRDNH